LPLKLENKAAGQTIHPVPRLACCVAAYLGPTCAAPTPGQTKTPPHRAGCAVTRQLCL